MELTKHANGQDWWIIIPQFESNCYHTLIFQEGKFEYDTLQCIGQFWDERDVQNQQGFSPNGNNYARFSYHQGLNIYDFDNRSGLFSNHLKIDFGFTDTVAHTGVIFSPNSRYVYVSAFNNVFQFDLDAISIPESRVLIATLNTPDSLMFKTRFTRGALAPDGKIYIGGSVQYNFLHVIHNPDCKGLNSNLEQYGIKLSDFPHSSSQSVPNIPHFRNQPQEINCDTVDIINSVSVDLLSDKISIYPNPVEDELTIDFQYLQAEFKQIKIISLHGHELYSTLINRSSSNKFQFSLSRLENGMYYVLFLDRQGKIRARKKVIKL